MEITEFVAMNRSKRGKKNLFCKYITDCIIDVAPDAIQCFSVVMSTGFFLGLCLYLFSLVFVKKGLLFGIHDLDKTFSNGEATKHPSIE